MDLQQIGLQAPGRRPDQGHPANRTGIPRRTFVAEGLYEINMVLTTGVDVDAFFWCPEAAYSDESAKRAEQLAERARRAYQVSAKTLERLAERPNPDGLMCVAQLPDWQPDQLQLAADALILVADAMEIPGNLGTLIRTLDACAADCLVLTSKRTRLTHPKVLRSSQGMSMKVPSVEFAEIGDAIDWLGAPVHRVSGRHQGEHQLPAGRLPGPDRAGRRQRAVRHLAALVRPRIPADRHPDARHGRLAERVGLRVGAALRGTRAQERLVTAGRDAKPARSPQSRPGRPTQSMSRLTTMASCVDRAITTTAAWSGDGFSSRCGDVRRHPDVVAGLGFQPDQLAGGGVAEHEHGRARHHVDPGLGLAVVVVAGGHAGRQLGAAHPQRPRPGQVAGDRG